MTTRHIWGAAVFLLLGCGSETGEPNPRVIELPQLLPAPSSLEGWNIGAGPDEYLPENLYQYFDGAAPRYLTYGFRKLVHVRYEFGGDLLSSVTVNILDMGHKLGAFGIFRSGMPVDAVLRDWGTEGYRSGTMAAAWKDRIFVQAEVDDDRTVLINMLNRLMTRIFREIQGDSTLPEILDHFPSDGLILLSERYVAADLFGHTFLPGGIRAKYDVEGDESELFFSDLGDQDSATEAIASLRDFQSEWGTIIRDVPSIGTGGFSFSDPGLGPGIVVSASHYVAGVHGDHLNDAQLHMLSRLVDRLSLKP